jgi:hypothetical protein
MSDLVGYIYTVIYYWAYEFICRDNPGPNESGAIVNGEFVSIWKVSYLGGFYFGIRLDRQP